MAKSPQSRGGASGKKKGRSDYGRTPSKSGRASGASQGRGGQQGRGSQQGRGNQQGRGAQPGRDRDPKRRDLRGAAVNLPLWVVEELARVTPKERVAPALEALGEGAAAFTDGRYQQARKWAEKAKSLASRDATTRELLGLSAYRLGDWGAALRELRTYRRLAGETTHMPVEMDCLRALGRDDDATEVWEELQRRGGRPGVVKEGRVVYASMLVDNGQIEAARRLVAPRQIKPDPFPEDLRLWYVAARAAALDGDAEEAQRLRNAILASDPGFPGIDELESLIAAA